MIATSDAAPGLIVTMRFVHFNLLSPTIARSHMHTYASTHWDTSRFYTILIEVVFPFIHTNASTYTNANLHTHAHIYARTYTHTTYISLFFRILRSEHLSESFFSDSFRTFSGIPRPTAIAAMREVSQLRRWARGEEPAPQLLVLGEIIRVLSFISLSVRFSYRFLSRYSLSLSFCPSASLLVCFRSFFFSPLSLSLFFSFLSLSLFCCFSPPSLSPCLFRPPTFSFTLTLPVYPFLLLFLSMPLFSFAFALYLSFS